MPIECHIKITDERGASEEGWLFTQTFQVVPRVGELVAFSRDGKRDERGVLRADLYRVLRVIQTAADDSGDGMVTLEATIEQRADL